MDATKGKTSCSAASPLRALTRAQVIGGDPRREGVAHDDVERSLARPVEDRASIAHSDLDLRGLGDGEVLAHLFGQQTVDLDGDMPRLRMRR